jgi:hypothetical protein
MRLRSRFCYILLGIAIHFLRICEMDAFSIRATTTALQVTTFLAKASFNTNAPTLTTLYDPVSSCRDRWVIPNPASDDSSFFIYSTGQNDYYGPTLIDPHYASCNLRRMKEATSAQECARRTKRSLKSLNYNSVPAGLRPTAGQPCAAEGM